MHAVAYARAQEDDDAPLDIEDEVEVEEVETPQAPPRVIYRRPSHPLTDLAPPHPDVETVYAFVKHADKNLPVGESISIICGFVNNADTPINVTGVMGSVNSPQQFSFYVQNFTGMMVNETVGPESEISFEYNFETHPMLDPLEWQVALTVFYEDGTSGFTSTFYNETVNFYEPPKPWDTESVVKALLAVGAVVLGLMYWAGKIDPFAQTTKNPDEGKKYDDDWLSSLDTVTGVKATKSRGRSGKKKE